MSRNERRALMAAAAAIGLSMTPADAARLIEPTGFAELRQLVEAHPDIDQAIFPGLSAALLLMGGKKAGLRVQDVFNTSLWTGTGAARTITTGIDSGEGSLVWLKCRNEPFDPRVFDTDRGANAILSSNSSAGSQSYPNFLTAFSSVGYSLGNDTSVNGISRTYVGWQFRRAKKFFDIVQYTGNGVQGRQIAHNLGVAPGLIIVKTLSTTSDWTVYHRSRAKDQFGLLNQPGIFASSGQYWGASEPNASHFFLGGLGGVNGAGNNYIAYLFAHDPTPEGVIQCGAFTGSQTYNLGWRPQYMLFKSATSVGDWQIRDTTRDVSFQLSLFPNTNAAEGVLGGITLTPNGFDTTSGFPSNQTFIYMAIREAA